MVDPNDRRAAERLQAGADAVCTFVSPVVEDFGAAKIKNVSMDGIGLVVSRKVEPGALLTVTLAHAQRGFSKIVLVRVVHVTPQVGGFLVGGTFSAPLTYQELTTLVL